MIEDSEVKDLADRLGAVQHSSSYILSADSNGLFANSIPLLHEIRGSEQYKRKLYDASIELYRLLEAAAVRRGPLSADVIVNDAPEFTARTMRRTVQALEVLLHSFAYIASRPKNDRKCIGVPLNNNDFSSGIYAHLNRDAMRRAVYALRNLGQDEASPWVEYHAHFYNNEIREGIRTRMAPTGRMKDWMIQRGLIFVRHPDGIKRTRPAPKQESPLLRLTFKDDASSIEGGVPSLGINSRPLDRPLIGDEMILPILNEKLAGTPVGVRWPDYNAYEANWDYSEGRTKSALTGGTTLGRSFSREDGRGGRLYGHWVQYAPRAVRKHLTIRGQPTVEADYRAMQPVLLYALSGSPLPEGDPYAPPGQDWERDRMKIVFTRSVGVGSKAQALGSIGWGLKELGGTYEGEAEELYEKFWRFHQAVWPHHPEVEGPMWPQLQYADSQIALRVLRLLLDQGIVAVPIHDSFVVQEKHKTALEAAMLDAFRQFYPNHKIKVEVKAA